MRDIHASGLHSASSAEWDNLGRAIARTADLAGLTECRHHIEVNGWSGYVPAKDSKGAPNEAECSIIWDDTVFGPEHPTGDTQGYAWLTRRPFYTGKGAKRGGVVATWVLLSHVRTDQTVLRVVAHMPSSVQARDKFGKKLARNLAWRSALSGMVALVRELELVLDPDVIIVSADFNVDFDRRSWRDRVARPLGSLKRAGLVLQPAKGGTLGDRTIDAHATSLRPEMVRVMDRVNGFDHRPVHLSN